MNSIQYSLNDKNIKTSRPGVFIFKLKENENLPTVPVGTKIIISGFKDSLSEANGVFNINEVYTDSSSQLVIKYVNQRVL